MLRKPLLAVLLITYNHKPYVSRAIESILEQKTDFGFEIHVFDDGSTDGTSDIVRKYAQKYPDIVIPFINDKNIGAWENVPQAFKSVKTKYYAYLEGDDYWCNENKLQIAVDSLEKHPECILFGHNTVCKHLNGDYPDEIVIGDCIKPQNSRKIYYLEDEFFRVHSSSWVVRNIVDFNKLVNHYFEDIILYKIFLSRGALYYHEEIMSVYNITGKGVWTGLSEEEQAVFQNGVYDNIKEYLNKVNYTGTTSVEYLKKRKTQSHIDRLAERYKDKKLLIYGAGAFFDVIQENFDLSRLNIVTISDKKFEQDAEYKGLKAVPPSSIKDLSFDAMVIAMAQPHRLENQLKQDLYPECGEFKIDYFIDYSVDTEPAYVKIPCIVLIYFDHEIIKKSLDFISKYSNLLDITVIENKSDSTEEQIKPYVTGLLKEGKIAQYALFDENIGCNAVETVLNHNLINMESDYIISTDGDLTIENENWLSEHLAIINQPNVFCVGTQLDMSNLPNMDGADKWVPKPFSEDNPIYINGLAGWCFATFKKEDFLNAYEYVKQNNLPYGDFTFQKYCREQRKKWARTRLAKAYHHTWDSYADPEHPYTKWKTSLTYQEVWQHRKYCGFAVYNKDRSEYYPHTGAD